MNNKSDKFLKLIEILKKLRSPDGCEWDKEQTHESLIPYLIEETYEVIEAIEEKDNQALKEEWGDLILHVLFQAELSSEKNENVKSSISTLIHQEKFKENRNLPEYLKLVPIKKLIKKNIFVNPTETNIDEVLNSMTMVVLKKYCSELEVKPGKTKKDTIDRLLEKSIIEKINFL